MSPSHTPHVYVVSKRLVKSAFLFLLIASAALFAPASRADDLHYFKNYFVTGDYTTAGVGLYGKGVSGKATGTINMTTVPAGADIIAAFLYWQTLETSAIAAPSAINGTFDGNTIVGDLIGNPAAQAPGCWTPEGTTSSTAYARTYRADVLRYLTINTALNIRTADYAHTVILPDSGTGAITTTLPHTMGATLVIVYRMLPLLSAPYKSVVIYDGSDTLTKSSAAFAQTIGGFYQAAGSGAKMTQIVGNGQSNMDVNLTVNGATPPGTNNDEFVGALGTRWDSPTFNINLPLNAATLTTQALAENGSTCLSWSAVIMSTNVVDSDLDGLLDIWESQGLHLNPGTSGALATSTTPAVPQVAATFGTCVTYPNDPAAPCENFPKMGAINGVRDIFIQVDWMSGNDANNYQHVHVPKLTALQMIANTFASHGLIALHFDVGSHYQQTPALPYIIPAAYARGGQVIPESPLYECPNQYIASADCAYQSAESPLEYSVLGWKIGFDAIANGFPSMKINPYFSHDRKDTFHYLLMGHALSGPFNSAGMAESATPFSASGVADTPGGDLLVTLGLWPAYNPANCVQDDPTGKNTNICTNETGTTIEQAGTIMHELGHNLGLYHGGSVSLPNCMPDYPSSMNYLYQARGLTDAQGNEHVDFSFGLLNGLNEKSLSETQSMGILLYRVRYFAPPNPNVPGQTAAASNLHCDGSSTPSDGNEIRLETPGIQTPDWNNNGKVDAGTVAVDVNFNGTVGDVKADSVEPSDTNANDPKKVWFSDHSDWLTLNLQQIGGRSNVNGLSADISSTDLGQNDLGQNDLGQNDLGQNDLGQNDLGQNDLGQNDLGQNDLGDEYTYNIATATLEATGTTTPLAAAVGASSGTAYNQITLTWGLPGIGVIQTYTIYRTNLSASTPTTVVAGTVSGTATTPPPTTWTDVVGAQGDLSGGSSLDSGAACPSSDVCYNANYQYYIIGQDGTGKPTGPSNMVTATVDHLFVTANNVMIVYGTADPASYTATVTGLPSGGITSSSYTCSVSGSPINAGGYPITCTGPPTVGTGNVYGVTYVAGTLTIKPAPLAVTVNPLQTKVYGQTDPTLTYMATGFKYTDSANSVFTGALARAAGENVIPAPGYAITQGSLTPNSNYFVSSFTGNFFTITPAPLMVTAIPQTKVYGQMDPPLTYTVMGMQFGQLATSVVTGSLTRAAGENVNTSPGYAISQGTLTPSSSNYTINMFTGSYLTITPAPLAATYTGTQVYGGTPGFTAIFSGFVNGDSSSVVSPSAPLSCLTNATSTSPVGYVYTVSSCPALTATNYTITASYGTLFVVPAQLTAIVTGAVSSGPPATFSVGTVSYSGFVGSDDSSVVSGTLTCAVDSAYTDASGNNPLACSGVGAANYIIDYSYSVGGTDAANAPLDVFVYGTQTYGGPPVFAATYSGFVNSDTVSVVAGTLTCSTNANSTSPGGSSYTITNCSGLSATGGGGVTYSLNYLYGKLSVTPLYSSDPALADFTSGIINYATFLLQTPLATDPPTAILTSDMTLPYTPTGLSGDPLTSGDRVYPNVDGASIIVSLPSATSQIRVFPNIDHFGTAYDGYQYSISGGNGADCTKATYTPLFDSTLVTGTGEPFTLGSFTGTGPIKVNNVLTPGASSGGIVGYEADFVFSQAYNCYSFGASTQAIASGNADQELSGVAALPMP